MCPHRSAGCDKSLSPHFCFVPLSADQTDFNEEIEIVSMLPSNYQDLVNEDDDRRGPFLITQNTKVTFLARRYRLVFVLDLSPSMSTVVSCGE